MPALPVDPKTGKERCLACGSCARVCPEQIITIEHEVGEDKKRRVVDFKIDMSRCMFCGLCTEACPTKGLVMSDRYELSSFSRGEMIYNLEQLREIGGTFPEEPADAEECAEEEKPSTGGAA
jgi:NADH-quinone oxidoreductase subunit I